jgi:hypothetical protein
MEPMARLPIAFLLLSIGVLAAAAGQPPDAALWNADGTAAVSAVPGETVTRVTAFLKQQDGTFLEVDLSGAEDRHVGRLGHRRTEYDRVETRAIEWLSRQDDLLQVRIQTQAWRAGQRYTVSEPVVLRRDGTVLWR